MRRHRGRIQIAGVPEFRKGVVAWKRQRENDPTFDQFACHPRTAKLLTVIFNLDGLVIELAAFMDETNYSVELHRALTNAKQYYLGDKAPTNARLLKLSNKTVKTQTAQPRAFPAAGDVAGHLARMEQAWQDEQWHRQAWQDEQQAWHGQHGERRRLGADSQPASQAEAEAEAGEKESGDESEVSAQTSAWVLPGGSPTTQTSPGYYGPLPETVVRSAPPDPPTSGPGSPSSRRAPPIAREALMGSSGSTARATAQQADGHSDVALRELPRGPVVAWVPNGRSLVVLEESGESVLVQMADTPSVKGWAKLQNIK